MVKIVTANRPHIIIKKKKTCILIDVAIPADRTVMQKEVERKLKHNSLYAGIRQMWNMKCMIILVITEAIRTRLKKNLEAITRKYSIVALPKRATLGTESTAVRNLKPELWGSPLVQEKYQGEKACDKRQHNKIFLNFRQSQYRVCY
jgi:hypothetical protein